MAALFDRFEKDVNRLVWRFLGADADHDDLVQQVFMEALVGVKKVRESGGLRGWMVCLTVNKVRSELRRRRVRRWFSGGATSDAPEPKHVDDHDAREALQRTYAVLDELAANQRLVFVLRYIEGLPLAEVAEACSCSLATVKRHLQRAEGRFVERAKKDPVLRERLRCGTRFDSESTEEGVAS